MSGLLYNGGEDNYWQGMERIHPLERKAPNVFFFFFLGGGGGFPKKIKKKKN